MPPITPTRTLLTACALLTSTAAFLADWSPSHILNPRWPPHAKFHNGQTMSFALILGLLALYYTWRPTSQPKDSLRTAAIFCSVYYVAGLSAILYPGTLAVDPEFGEGFPQFWGFVGMAVVPWVGVVVG